MAINMDKDKTASFATTIVFILVIGIVVIVYMNVFSPNYTCTESHHNFEPRYSTITGPIKESASLAVIMNNYQASNATRLHAMESTKEKKKIYHYDICPDCGTIVNNDEHDPLKAVVEDHK